MYKKIGAIAVVALLLDQITKILVEANMPLNGSITVISNFFWLRHINNYGAAWGLFYNQTMLLIGVSLLALVIMIRYMNTFKNNLRNTIAFGIILGGITGNLIDRMFLGYVRDFLAFNIFGYKFPIFNIADTAITIGIVLLIYAILKGEDDGSTSKQKPKKN